MTELVLDSGKGSRVTTLDGRTFLDMTTGIGVVNTGHCHPRVVKAAQDQLGKLMHGQVNIAFQKPMLDLCKRLSTKVMPFDLDMYFFWNSGAEAVEAAVKLARHATRKPGLIVFQVHRHRHRQRGPWPAPPRQPAAVVRRCRRRKRHPHHSKWFSRPFDNPITGSIGKVCIAGGLCSSGACLLCL